MSPDPAVGPRPAFIRDIPFDRSPEEEAARRKVREMQQPAKGAADKHISEIRGPANPAADPDVKRLAAMPPLEYDRIRQEEAERLGVRVGTLDKEVARLRCGGDGEAAGAAVALPMPEPWPEPVDGAELLDALVNVVKRHLVVPAGAAEATALWMVHAHAHDTAAISPILAVTSPTPECGKTTLLTILGALVPRPLPASNITAAALFRAVEKWQPTLLVDEADTFLRNSDELRGVVNSGHNRAAAYVIRTVGDDHEPRRFATWAPKAIALIGKLPATLASRSIHVELRRMAPGEKVVAVRADRLHDLEPIARKAARWAADNGVTLRSAEPEMPRALAGRRADNWRHLIAIADAARGNWPQRARQAAESLTCADSSETAAIMLLADIRDIFNGRSTDRLSSKELVDALTELEDRPWVEWKLGKPITRNGLAKLLSPFQIKPKQLRFADGRAGISGYSRDAFLDAFTRYLPDQNSTTLHAGGVAASGPAQISTPNQPVEFPMGRNPNHSADCRGVEVQKPEGWEGEL
ncbi:MAG TPA: DUF3631 domain-containing protein [Afifellaceae bacterium]|nr:DUF3631 domain-containing protein [Afifellaceae bacterium]